MSTISFATTQMNLINCVEYVSSKKGSHILFVDSVSSSRKKQMLYLLQTPSYSKIFQKVYCRANSDYRILDFLFTLYYYFELFVLSRIMRFEEIVSGNYLCCGSRLFFAFSSNNVKYIACDDGTGTIAVAKQRPEEGKMAKPLMYLPNRLLKIIVCHNKMKFIPKTITFFTNYSIESNGKDEIIKHDYCYLKQHLNDFNIDSTILKSNTIVLGEPLYFKNFTTKECYAQKLKQYAETAKSPIVYYAHPEETISKWADLEVQERYKYIDNFLPFEIIAVLLPDKCRIATFISSVLMNIRMINDKLEPECICFKKEEVLPQFSYDNVLMLYKHYASLGVKFYEFN